MMTGGVLPSSDSFEGLLRVVADPERAAKTIKELQAAKREADAANEELAQRQAAIVDMQEKLDGDRKALEERAETVNRQFAELREFAMALERAKAGFERQKQEFDREMENRSRDLQEREDAAIQAVDHAAVQSKRAEMAEAAARGVQREAEATMMRLKAALEGS